MKSSIKSRSVPAVISGVLGLFGLIGGPFLGIPAVILGIIALTQISERRQKGSVWAWIGICSGALYSILPIALLGIFFYNVIHLTPYQHSDNDAALANMTEQESLYFNTTLRNITSQDTQEDIKNLLGEPKKIIRAISPMYYYNCPEGSSPTCEIKIGFYFNKAFSLGFADPPRFIYSTLVQNLEATSSGSVRSVDKKRERVGESIKELENVFKKINVTTTMDTKKELIYSYFFYDPDLNKLKTIKDALIEREFVVISVYKVEDAEEYGLHVAEKAIHTSESLLKRNIEFNDMAETYDVEAYDGYEINPIPESSSTEKPENIKDTPINNQML